MLVVVAIIGMLSLVSVPAFINYQRTMKLRGAVRTLNTDIRNCRQMAISRNVIVRLEFADARRYQTVMSSDGGTTWQRLPLRVQDDENIVGANVRYFDEIVSLADVTFVDDEDDENELRDVDFHSDGTVWDNGAIAGGSFAIRTSYEATINRVDITISTTGQISSTESKV
jgi:type II secretory pathway pseudopilin PulG